MLPGENTVSLTITNTQYWYCIQCLYIASGKISAYDSGPTGLFYHRIVVFPFSNPVTNTRQVNYNQAEMVCEAVEKQ